MCTCSPVHPQNLCRDFVIVPMGLEPMCRRSALADLRDFKVYKLTLVIFQILPVFSNDKDSETLLFSESSQVSK